MTRYTYLRKVNSHFNSYLIPQVRIFYDNKRFLILKFICSLSYFPGLKDMAVAKERMSEDDTTP